MKPFTTLFSSFALALLLSSAAIAAPTAKPNIIYILADESEKGISTLLRPCDGLQ